jgi:hypothetical protein
MLDANHAFRLVESALFPQARRSPTPGNAVESYLRDCEVSAAAGVTSKRRLSSNFTGSLAVGPWMIPRSLLFT